MKGMKTTADNAKMLTELSEFWSDNELSDGKVLLFGDVCGLGFYLDTDVAISTAWPNLPSFTVQKFRNEIANLEGFVDQKGASLPAVVIQDESGDGMKMINVDKKQEILNDFLDKYDYSVAYSNDVLRVYLPLEH